MLTAVEVLEERWSNSIPGRAVAWGLEGREATVVLHDLGQSPGPAARSLP